MSGKGHRIYYVRYADDFLIGVNGPENLAIKLKSEIASFLKTELKLEMNLDKTKITSAVKERAKFLGADIRVLTSRTNDQPRSKGKGLDNRVTKKRFPQKGIIILAPIDRLTKKLAEQGMCRIDNLSRREVIPTRKTA